MGVLQYPTALATVQDAIVSTITLALGVRETAADLTALAAIPSRSGGTIAILDRKLCYVTGPATVYRFSQYSTAAPDGTNTIAPNDASGASGRWLLMSSTILDATGTALSSVPSGYLRRVMVWAGERSDKIWKVRILGQRPAVILQFTGETKTIRANQRGALTEKTYHFSLWGVSQNLRPDIEGEKGSPIAAESAADPGVARIMGDLEYLLDGLRGVDMGIDGLDFLQFGANQTGIEDYDGREFVWTAPLDVRVTIGKEDPARAELTSLYVQPYNVQLHSQSTFDSLNYVQGGLAIAIGAGFSKAPSDGSAVIAGAVVTVTSAAAHSFTANRATWRDLNANGSWTYTETYTDGTPPTLAAGALRVAVTFTDFAGVVDDRFIAATAQPAGPNNQILP